MKRLVTFLRTVSEVSSFFRLPDSQREVVFYAEDEGSYVHFAEVIRALTREHQVRVTYLTSSENDPILHTPPDGVMPLFVGRGAALTYLFQTLRAKVMVLTMPDIETFHLKRSRFQKVTYAYLFHSMVSTHVIYRETAFDHFDVVLTVGPHHEAEIRQRELKFNLPAKTLLPTGYGRLDEMLRSAKDTKPEPGHILIAPSWGPHGILENHALEVVTSLLDAGFRVSVRPHPRTTRSHSRVLNRLLEKFRANRNFRLDTDKQSLLSFSQAEILISDWSGAALEFAFAYRRPVLFLDVPQKVNNPRHAELGLEAVEKNLREEVGRVLSVQNLRELPAAARSLIRQRKGFVKRIEKARKKTVYNLGESGDRAALHLLQLLRGTSEAPLRRRKSHAK